MATYVLDWNGPYGFSSPDERGNFHPPRSSGLYLWTIDGPDGFQISCVGQTRDLQRRLYEHITGTLGGRYYLYGDAHLEEGKDPNQHVAYQPGLLRVLTDFLGDYQRYSAVALRNLHAFKMFWALVDEKSETLRAIEAVLINDAYEQGVPVQNAPPKSGYGAHLPSVASSLPDGVTISGLK